MDVSRRNPLTVAVLLILFLAGLGTLAYARWGKPLLDADRALAAGDRQAALDRYAAAEQRLGWLPGVRYAFAADRARAVDNQLALLFHAGNYDAVLEKATSAPGAAPHFWSGVVLLTRAIGEKDPEARLVGLTRAEEALRQALQAAPDDWDTKFNYEIAARLAARLRLDPKKMESPLQLLRPQPTRGRPARRVG